MPCALSSALVMGGCRGLGLNGAMVPLVLCGQYRPDRALARPRAGLTRHRHRGLYKGCSGEHTRMGQPSAEVIALVKDEDLGLVREPPECGCMDDAVAVAAEGVARRAHRLRIQPAAAPARSGRIGGARAGRLNRHTEPPN